MLTTSLACFFVAVDYKIILDVFIPHCLLVLSDIFQKPLVVVIFSSSPGTNHFFSILYLEEGLFSVPITDSIRVAVWDGLGAKTWASKVTDKKQYTLLERIFHF